MSAKTAKTRVQLTDADRKLICELAKSNRDLSQDKLTSLAAQQLGKDLKRTTVTGVLKDSDKWLKCTHSSASRQIKHRAPQYEQLEAVVYEWFGQVRARDGQIIDSLLVEKAKALAEKLHLPDFKASDGWLANFKKRHNIKLQRPHGESGAADLEGVDVARTVIGKVITELNYQLENSSCV